VSFNDGSSDGPVQPEQGQGEGGGGGGAPYQEYLERIQDEEARGIAEEGFKSFDANVAKKFSEHASYRKGWAPYEELGLREQDPQVVGWAMQLAQAAQTDPQAFYEWVNGDYANQYGLQQQQQAADEFGGGYEDPNQQLTQRIEQLEGMLQGVDGRFQEQAQAQAQQEALRMIEGQISEIEKTAGDAFDRAALEMVLPHFTESATSREELESAVPRAWEALQGLLNKREQQAFSGKLSQGRAPEASGMPDVTPPQDHTLKEAHARAMEIAQRGSMR
jgi:hypothetical protein